MKAKPKTTWLEKQLEKQHDVICAIADGRQIAHRLRTVHGIDEFDWEDVPKDHFFNFSSFYEYRIKPSTYNSTKFMNSSNSYSLVG